MMSQLHRRHIKGNRAEPLRLAHHVFGRHKMKFRLRVHKLPNQPRARHSIHLHMLARDPFHRRASCSPEPKSDHQRTVHVPLDLQNTSPDSWTVFCRSLSPVERILSTLTCSVARPNIRNSKTPIFFFPGWSSVEAFVSDWRFAQKNASEELAFLHHFSFKKQQSGSEITFLIT